MMRYKRILSALVLMTVTGCAQLFPQGVCAEKPDTKEEIKLQNQEASYSAITIVKSDSGNLK